ncbi:nitroreductase family protein [Patescibacteria group bacterium]
MGILNDIAKKQRTNSEDVLNEIIYRWSPKIMNGEEVSDEDLTPLFEAARWAPSSNNNQEWQFYYATKSQKSFEKLFNILFEGNKKWSKNAGALIVLISKKRSDYKEKPINTHSFDTGMAFQNFAIEGIRRDMVVRPMGGFDKKLAHKILDLNEKQHIECMISVGRIGDISLFKGVELSQRNNQETFAFKID